MWFRAPNQRSSPSPRCSLWYSVAFMCSSVRSMSSVKYMTSQKPMPKEAAKVNPTLIVALATLNATKVPTATSAAFCYCFSTQQSLTKLTAAKFAT